MSTSSTCASPPTGRRARAAGFTWRALAGLPLWALSSGCFAHPLAEDNLLPERGGGTGGECLGTGGEGAPATYRFTCIDIQAAGNQGEESLIVGVLETTWKSDLEGYRLNILVDWASHDEDSNVGQMRIRSGIGPDSCDQCSEMNSDSVVLEAPLELGESVWEPIEWDSEEPHPTGACSQPADASAPAYGTFHLSTGASDVIYIYAEDDEGQTFNCTSDESPDAVPIHAIEAEFTLSEDQQMASGNLVGCLVKSEAENICSCLGTCAPEEQGFEQCACNPYAVPLGVRLGSVLPTENCTNLMGEDAYDVQLGFVAMRLDEPPVPCEE